MGGAEIESDTVGCFQAVISIMFSLQGDHQPIVEKIITCLIKDTSNKISLRLKVLVCVFNMLVTSQSKLAVIKATFKYALDSSQSSVVSKFHDKVSYWINEWKLNIEDQRELYQLISDILGKDGREEALVYLVKYLDSYVGESYPIDVQKRVEEAVLSAVRSPVHAYDDRLKLYEALSKQQFGSTDLGKLVELLRILCSDTLQTYKKFAAENATIFSNFNLDQQNVERSMKLLTLCTLGSKMKFLSYAKIAEELEIKYEDVEEWVVDAISNKLLEASMDQFKSQVQVIKSANRSFDKEQWESLLTRLNELKDNMKGIMNTVKNNEK